MTQGFVKENINLRDRYDLLAKHYNNRLNHYVPKHTKLLEPFMKLLKQDFNEPKVIDIGCGVGLNTTILEKNGFDVLGLDYSDNSLRHAINNCPASKFVHSDFLSWNSDEKFHGVVAGSFFDKFHPDLVPEIFDKVDSLLVNGGYGLVYMPLSEEKNEFDVPLTKKHMNPYVALIERDKWSQMIMNKFKIVNYYEGYGNRDWFVSIFKKE